MGIPKLLQELKPIIRQRHISDFARQTCGIDASCWLHKAAYSYCSALDIIFGKHTTKWLQYTLKYIQLLICNNITPIMVFDGDKLPIKANEENKRNKSRENHKNKAIEYNKAGDKENADKYAKGAVQITKEMVTQCINQCIQNDIEYVCAPYEADAQLGYMYKTGDINFVITEDSDLLLFGVRRVLYKFKIDNEMGDYLDMDEIQNYKQPTNKKDLCSFLKQYNDIKDLIYVCVWSGCDYMKSIKGIALKTAIKHCYQFPRIDFYHLVNKLKKEKKQKVPKDYVIRFKRARLTFLYQTVYDTKDRKLTHLNPIIDQDKNDYFDEIDRYLLRLPLQSNGNNDNNDDNDTNPTVYDKSFNFLGKKINNNIARLIAEGKIDARSREKRNLITFNENMRDNINKGSKQIYPLERNRNIKRKREPLIDITNDVSVLTPHRKKRRMERNNDSNQENKDSTMNSIDSKQDVEQKLSAMAFDPDLVTRAFKVYERKYGAVYNDINNAEVITEIICRLQYKDESNNE